MLMWFAVTSCLVYLGLVNQLSYYKNGFQCASVPSMTDTKMQSQRSCTKMNLSSGIWFQKYGVVEKEHQQFAKPEASLWKFFPIIRFAKSSAGDSVLSDAQSKQKSSLFRNALTNEIYTYSCKCTVFSVYHGNGLSDKSHIILTAIWKDVLEHVNKTSGLAVYERYFLCHL